jgi:hypothetical protein
MTEPVLIKRSILIAVMVVVQTVAPPLVALASLYLVARSWHVSFAASPSTLAVIITLQFLVLIRPPRDLGAQLSWRPLATSLEVLGRWLVLTIVLLIIGHFTDTIRLFPHGAYQAWEIMTPLLLVLTTLIGGLLMRRLATAKSSLPATTSVAWRWLAVLRPIPRCRCGLRDSSTIAARIGSTWRPIPGWWGGSRSWPDSPRSAAST